jgi:hypothetical protein
MAKVSKNTKVTNSEAIRVIENFFGFITIYIEDIKDAKNKNFHEKGS